MSYPKTSTECRQGRGKRAGKKDGKIRNGKRTRRETYGIYNYNVLKQVHADVGVSSKAMSIMLSLSTPPASIDVHYASWKRSFLRLQILKHIIC